MDCIITSYTRAYYYFAHRISDSPSPVNRPSAIATLPITFDDVIALLMLGRMRSRCCCGRERCDRALSWEECDRVAAVEGKDAIALCLGKNAIALLVLGECDRLLQAAIFQHQSDT
ncbi:hypothetical protein H6F61_07635 [Cyanobacteria bacterium FACHB-472]|nr:hypothetical protein [Cyanobacteria bacterium FACHB-472]